MLICPISILLYKNFVGSPSLQSPDELMEMAHKYYDDVALPKLVSFIILSMFLNQVILELV